MVRTKRITANLPKDLLDEGRKATGKGVTETLIEGLKMLKRSRALDKLRALRGKIHLDLDLDVSRERHRR